MMKSKIYNSRKLSNLKLGVKVQLMKEIKKKKLKQNLLWVNRLLQHHYKIRRKK
jgi:protein-arginine kinase